MALVLDECTQVSYTFVDREYSLGKQQMHFDNVGSGVPPLTFDSIETEAIGTFGPWVPGGTWAVLQALSDCPIAAASISVAYHESDPGSTVGAGEAEVKGNFQFQDANEDYFTITVPGLLDTVLQPNGRDIDPLNGAVVAFANAIMNQAGAADVRTINNVAPVQLSQAWKSHRRSHKRRTVRRG